MRRIYILPRDHFIRRPAVPCADIASTAPTFTFGGREFPVSVDTWNLGPIDPNPKYCRTGMAAWNHSMFFAIRVAAIGLAHSR